MRRRPIFFTVPVLLAAVAAACGGAQTPDANRPRGDVSRMLADTPVGQDRCAITRSHDRPFVIEWDATDRSTFEAVAARDLVVVKYEGCHMTVLDGCSDDGIPGRVGRYDAPRFTSGAVEGFEMRDENELYAQLPLGAARLAGRIQAGEALRLRYYVSGVVTATRSELFQSDVAPLKRCAGATHFVWAYNLGAFELDTSERSRATGGASVAGLGTGAEASRSTAVLKRGGQLASCESQDQRACRGPIRLVLRPLQEGTRPSAEPAVAPPSPAAPAAPSTPGANNEANALRDSASRKLRAGDGAGCLGDLDRALRIDPRPSYARWEGELRAQCEMKAGKCDAGKKRLREYLAAQDRDRKRTDDSLDDEVFKSSVELCPMAQGTPWERAARIHERMAEAARAKDAPKCTALSTDILALLPSLKPSTDREKHVFERIWYTLQDANACLRDTKTCGPAWLVYRTWRTTAFGSFDAGSLASALINFERDDFPCELPAAERPRAGAERVQYLTVRTLANGDGKEDARCGESALALVGFSDDDLDKHEMSAQALRRGRECLARLGRCPDAHRVWGRYKENVAWSFRRSIASEASAFQRERRKANAAEAAREPEPACPARP